MTGVEMIAAERERQVNSEGWDASHDDEHDSGELTEAAIAYAEASQWEEHEGTPVNWPWDEKWWKPSPDPIRNLTKAGALIAAEIDRLIRSI
jgi:hypothetical protein